MLNGSALYIKIPRFVDGGVCPSKRVFLVYENNGQINGKVLLLNVSTLTGKEHKASFPTNYVLKNYFPPFENPTFVKLDAIYEISYFTDLEKTLLCSGQHLDHLEMLNIKQKLDAFHQGQGCGTCCFSEIEMRQVNVF